MTGNKSRGYSIGRERKAASPAVSMVIITAATVVLVMVSGSFALQILDRQRASAEFDTVTKSLITFDDALRDIAWDRGGSRSVRFTASYGSVALVPDNKTIGITISEHPSVNYTLSTGVVKYTIPTNLVSYGDGYQFYVLGDENAVISSTTEDYGQLIAGQQSESLSLTLSYRVRVTEEGPSTAANYIDILVIRMNCINSSFLIGDFDLVAKNVGITTDSTQFAAGGSSVNINVSLDGVSSKPVTFGLNSELPVVFNLIVADVRVST